MVAALPVPSSAATSRGRRILREQRERRAGAAEQVAEAHREQQLEPEQQRREVAAAARPEQVAATARRPRPGRGPGPARRRCRPIRRARAWGADRRIPGRPALDRAALAAQTSSVTEPASRRRRARRGGRAPWRPSRRPRVGGARDRCARPRARPRAAPRRCCSMRSAPGAQQQPARVAQEHQLVQEAQQQQLEVRLAQLERLALARGARPPGSRAWRRAAPRPRRRTAPRASRRAPRRRCRWWRPRRTRSGAPPLIPSRSPTGSRCATRRERPACSLASATASTSL